MRQAGLINAAAARRLNRGDDILCRQKCPVRECHARDKRKIIRRCVLGHAEGLAELRDGAEFARNDEQALIQQRKGRAVDRCEAGIRIQTVFRQIRQSEAAVVLRGQRFARRLRFGGRLGRVRRGRRDIFRVGASCAAAEQQRQQQAHGDQLFHVVSPCSMMTAASEPRSFPTRRCDQKRSGWQAVQASQISICVTPARRSQMALHSFRFT